ncbi:hypothetical protein BP6252_04257 [Coleophoma cylindrospora]|uniref:Carboxylic ester hydrolase n=1 Tax=Coleophoma cylindrospora TaxID=1849047 RepID=A0A3D8RZZ8_9HELO|nr:hypothetical protein BP6252_04257 [Coleophoma cylindrospora]
MLIVLISAVLIVLQLVAGLPWLESRRGGLGGMVPQTDDAVVDLGYSTYQGTVLGGGVSQYLGMRYAAPPVGDLRWREPQEPVVTSEVQNATAFGDTCFGLGIAATSSSESEDCLFINVWAPSTTTPSSKLPVWFFIQGGGYNTNYDGSYNGTGVVEASENNIVFVSMNYRVSAWGFLASEKVREDGALNAGLLDQRLAMEWAQKYIHLFGGDPDHVVIHGVSAGAGSVALHLTAYGGRDDKLFVGAIGESVFFPTQPKVSELEFQFDSYATLAGCGGATDELTCLRAQNVSVLQTANVAMAFPGATGATIFYFTPCIDGDLIRQYPYLSFESGEFIDVPLMFGNANDEGSLFVNNATSPADVATWMVDYYPHLAPTDTDSINTQYPLMAAVAKHAAYFPSLAAAYGESTFTCPAITILQSYVQYFSASKAWSYRVNIQDQKDIAAGLGVSHTMEIPAIFGVGFVPGAASFATYNAPVVPVVMHYFISFIRSLTPNEFKYSEAPYWEPYTTAQRRMKLQTNATAMEDVPVDQLGRCAFWKGLAVTMEV